MIWWIRPITLSFLVIGTTLLAIVTFSVPYMKQIYLLKASFEHDGTRLDVVSGVLGYCFVFSNGTTCSSPSIGYSIVDAPITIPHLVPKRTTYMIFLHPIAALITVIPLAVEVFGHVRGIKIALCITLAALIAIVAFIVDIITFILARSTARHNGGEVKLGAATWLTLAACIFLLFSGYFLLAERKHRWMMDEKTITKATPQNNDIERSRSIVAQDRSDSLEKGSAGNASRKITLPSQTYEQQPLTKRESDEYLDEEQVNLSYTANQAGVGTASYGKEATSNLYRGHSQILPDPPSMNDLYISRHPPQKQGSASSMHAQGNMLYPACAQPISYARPEIPSPPPPVMHPVNMGYLSSTTGMQYTGSVLDAARNRVPGQIDYEPPSSAYQNPAYSAQTDLRPIFNDEICNSTAYMYGMNDLNPSVSFTPRPATSGSHHIPPTRQHPSPLRNYSINDDVHAISGDTNQQGPSIETREIVKSSSGVQRLLSTGPSSTGIEPMGEPSASAAVQEEQHDDDFDSPPMYDAAMAKPPAPEKKEIVLTAPGLDHSF